MTALLALLLAFLVLAFVLQDAFEVMLLPRRVSRRWRLTGIYFRATWATWTRLARATPAGARRERFLSIFGALSMTLLFSLWAVSLIIAFGLLQWVAQEGHGQGATSDLGEQIYMSGVTFFTLGYGDVVPQTSWARALAVFEAGAGFGLIAIVIGYLPVLYQLFSRREAHVIQLDGRAGSPPTATTMLCRHAESGGLDKVDDLLRVWEIWGADLLESHLSYPMLAYYRSQHDDQSWLGALAAIMDTCTLILIGVEDIKPLQARMTFAMLRGVIVELARSLQVSPIKSIDPPRLTDDDYASMMLSFEKVGLAWNGGEQAPETLAAVRATYEPLLQGLAEHLLLPLPGWIATQDDGPDHWERGSRGIIARRLVEGLADGSVASAARVPRRRGGTPARRLRDSLR
ncbi:MAG: two pore domain potassium channel family protein [Caulobacteraceae bacterium]|nr:two pore domain potassium channel family protein [Caulobacteraceae bacterium]